MRKDDERAAIIAWLRREEAQNRKVDIGGPEEISAKRFAVACKIIADAIERAEHRRDSEGIAQNEAPSNA